MKNLSEYRIEAMEILGVKKDPQSAVRVGLSKIPNDGEIGLTPLSVTLDVDSATEATLKGATADEIVIESLTYALEEIDDYRPIKPIRPSTMKKVN